MNSIHVIIVRHMAVLGLVFLLLNGSAAASNERQPPQLNVPGAGG